MVEAALAYARFGWRVLPLHNVDSDGESCSCRNPECKRGGKKEKSVGKHPRISNWQSEATFNEEKIRGWWKEWPRANIGIATGIESGVVGLDVDVHRGAPGFKSLTALEDELGLLPKTATVITGSGGQHRYFVYPSELDLKDSANWRGWKGIDWRAEGGQLVAPPSVGLAGVYRWADPGEPVVEPLPATWIEACRLFEASREKLEPTQASVLVDVTPEEAIKDERILVHLHSAKNAAKFKKLWEGVWDKLGYPSQSEADLALCSMIAFWCDPESPEPNADRIDRLFRRSALMREKWESASYRQRTLAFAVGREAERRDADEKLRQQIAATAMRSGASGSSPGDAGQGTDSPGDKSKVSIAEMLIGLAVSEDLIVDDRGETYAHVKVPDASGLHRELHHVRSRRFKVWLAGRLYQESGKAPSSEALSAALNVIEARARRDAQGEARMLANRVARGDDGAIWIDLADRTWRAVRVTAEGWEVRADPPPLFRRFSHQAPLPDPVRGGDVRQIFKYLNVAPGDHALFLGTLVAAMVPDIPQAILILHGPQGSAKTTAARLRRSLIDPSVKETDMGKLDFAEVVQRLDHNYMYFSDNLRTLPHWMAEILCQASTGAGFSKRQLHTDADDVIFTFRRPVTITCVTVPPAEPDFLDRVVLIHLSRMRSDQRLLESDLTQILKAARPALFGGLLDALSGAIRLYGSVKPDRLPRLADFTRWGAAAAEYLGYGAQSFTRAMFRNIEVKHAEIVDSDPVARAIVLLMRKHVAWNGTTSALYDKLNQERGYRTEEDWPKRSADLGRRLTLLQPVLAELGIEAKQAQETNGVNVGTWMLGVKRGVENVAEVQ